MAARHLAHRSFFATHFRRTKSSKEHNWAIAQFGSQGYLLANYIVWDLHRKALATHTEVSERAPERSAELQSELTEFSASASLLSTRMNELSSRFNAASFNEIDEMYDQVYDLSDELVSSLRSAADEYESLSQRSEHHGINDSVGSVFRAADHFPYFKCLRCCC